MTDHALRGRTRYPNLIDPQAAKYSPLDIAGIRAWVDLSDRRMLFTDAGINHVVNDGDPIYQVNDKSGNGFNFTQATAEKRPLYRPNIGHHGSVEFDGSNDTLIYPAPICWSSGTIFAMIYLSSNSQHGAVTGAGIRDFGWHFGLGASTLENNGNELIMLFSGIKWVDSGDLIGTGNKLLTMKVDNYNLTWYIDGVNSGTSVGSTVYPRKDTTIGGEGDAPNRFFTDHITEIIYYNVVLSDADRVSVENYLMLKHGIP